MKLQSDNLKSFFLGCALGITALSNYVYFKDGVNPFDAKKDFKNQVQVLSTPVIAQKTKYLYLSNKDTLIINEYDTTFLLLPKKRFNKL